MSSEVESMLQHELGAYRKELPRLLAEGQAGRFALLKKDRLLSVWDTQRDALQAGRELFGLEAIAVKKIDPLDVDRIALLDAQGEIACQS